MKDTRVPVSVTRKGIYTVTVYDEQAYNDALALYHQDSVSNPPARNPPRAPAPALDYKAKKAGRIKWAKPLASYYEKTG